LFAGVIVACGGLLDGVVAPRYETPLAFMTAMAVTAGSMLIVSGIVKRLHRGK
jgi:hypothetical protein